jgi:hypothetical protein
MPKQRTPSPGKLATHTAIADRMNADSDLFGEWQVLSEQCKGLKQHYVKALGKPRGKTVKVFAVGSPRAARVVLVMTSERVEYRKIIVVNIREGSWHTWLDKLDAVHWQVVQTFKVDMSNPH